MTSAQGRGRGKADKVQEFDHLLSAGMVEGAKLKTLADLIVGWIRRLAEPCSTDDDVAIAQNVHSMLVRSVRDAKKVI